MPGRVSQTIDFAKHCFEVFRFIGDRDLVGPEDLQLCPLLLISCWSWGREAEGVGSSREPFLTELTFKSRGVLLRCKEFAAAFL